ncbi:MAG: hypothetical protein EON94_14820, partial [Caulobacteraceae bacterium]
VDAAAAVGADTVKFQTFDPAELTSSDAPTAAAASTRARATASSPSWLTPASAMISGGTLIHDISRL